MLPLSCWPLTDHLCLHQHFQPLPHRHHCHQHHCQLICLHCQNHLSHALPLWWHLHPLCRLCHPPCPPHPTHWHLYWFHHPRPSRSPVGVIKQAPPWLRVWSGRSPPQLPQPGAHPERPTSPMSHTSLKRAPPSLPPGHLSLQNPWSCLVDASCLCPLLWQ